VKERELERRLVAGIKNLGGKAYKWESPGNAGVPDRIVILPGLPAIFVEMKTEKGRLTSLQEVQINKLLELGQDVIVLYGIRAVDDFLLAMGGKLNEN